MEKWFRAPDKEETDPTAFVSKGSRRDMKKSILNGIARAYPFFARGESKRRILGMALAAFALLACTVMTGCATHNYTLAFKTDVGVVESVSSKKLPLKAALYIPDPTKQYFTNASILQSILTVPFGQHIERASFNAFLQVFEEVSVVGGKNDFDQYDVVIEPAFVKEDTHIELGFKVSQVKVGVGYRVSDRDGVLWQKAFAAGRATDETFAGLQTTCGALLSAIVEQAARQVWIDFNNKTTIAKLYAKRPSPAKPISEAKVEAISEAPIVKSDIDELPAIAPPKNKNAYAIVIGVEQYRQKLPKADFATQDARLVANYLIKTMGYPEENVITLLNERALKSDFEKYFEKWLGNNVETGGKVFIYYSGHGAPDPKTGGAYLVPYDGDPTFIAETGYSLKRMYDALGKLPAKEIIVALDSCFSGGGGRSVLAKGARPLVMNIQGNMTVSKNMTILSASAGDQISSTYDEKGHGLFTYFLLKGIKNEDVVKADGSIRMDDLYSYLKPQVERIARKQYNNEQSPQLVGAAGK